MQHWTQIISGIVKVGIAHLVGLVQFSSAFATWFSIVRSFHSNFKLFSAIDNATRTLINHGQLPVTCGLFFSLGHSTIVIVVVRGLGLVGECSLYVTPESCHSYQYKRLQQVRWLQQRCLSYW